MKKIFTLSILFLASLLMAATSAQARDGKYIQKVFISNNGLPLNYVILYPENFSPEQAYPVLVFLHGSGERGDDNQAQLIHGGELMRTSDELSNVIVIVPQCPLYSSWAFTSGYTGYPPTPIENPVEAAVKELIDSFIKLGFADKDRIYGTGLSMGGMGILDMAIRYPNYFAAIEPICGGINPNRCAEYKGRTAFRFFHGSDDTAVNPDGSRLANQALIDAGHESSLIEYPGVKHGSWHNAFAEPDFFSWLLKH